MSAETKTSLASKLADVLVLVCEEQLGWVEDAIDIAETISDAFEDIGDLSAAKAFADAAARLYEKYETQTVPSKNNPPEEKALYHTDELLRKHRLLLEVPDDDPDAPRLVSWSSYRPATRKRAAAYIEGWKANRGFPGSEVIALLERGLAAC